MSGSPRGANSRLLPPRTKSVAWSASWSEAFATIAANMARANARRIGAIVGDLAAVEEIYALKDLMTRFGVANLDCRQDGSVLDPKWGRASYLFNSTIAGIETADALLLVGSNPRREAAVLNARIRKRWRTSRNFPIGLIGAKAPLSRENRGRVTRACRSMLAAMHSSVRDPGVGRTLCSHDVTGNLSERQRPRWAAPRSPEPSAAQFSKSLS